MRNFAFAALAAVAAAEAVDTPMTAVNFPQATAGDGLTADASLNEIVQTHADGQKSAVMWAQFSTTCMDCYIQNDGLVQNWMQMEGSEAGKFDGFTCTA